MAFIQFDDTVGEMHVFASFGNKDTLIGFGDEAFALVLDRIHADNQVEIRAIYDNIRKSDLEDYTITFNVADGDYPHGVSELKATVMGVEYVLGNYFVFAEGGGADGLMVRTKSRTSFSSENA